MSKEQLPLRVTADMIVDYKREGLVLIQRKWPPFSDHWALPGGHLEVGEEDTLTAAIRETREETNLQIPEDRVKLLGIYSDPHRDPRGHYITAAYYCSVFEGELRALDDAKKIAVFPFERLPKELAFDHATIIVDFLRLRNNLSPRMFRYLRQLLRKRDGRFI